MINTTLFNRLLTIELRNGIGLDFEFVDSRPVWVFNALGLTSSARPFYGVVVLLPFLTISYGRVCSEVD